MHVETIARLGMWLLTVGEILAVAAMLLIPKRRVWCPVLLALAYAAVIGAVFCIVYETRYYGF